MVFPMRAISHFVGAGLLLSLAPMSANAQGAPSAGAVLADDARLASDRAEDTAALSHRWKKGQRMVADGEELVKRSNRRLADLARDIKSLQAKADEAVADQAKEETSLAKGRQLIVEGRGLQGQAEGSTVAGAGA
jgi:Skp family chaperone for outer membrane proteins